jgi:Glucose / Sorbosone dehydrogenase/Secretion system C-terminal sorting domain
MKTFVSFLIFFCPLFFNAQNIALQSFATGFVNPVAIAHAGDSRLFVVEQGGKIKILNANGTTNATPFLTVTGLSNGGEQGLLGLAFHPNYATNGLFFINYTRTNGDTVIAKYKVNPSNPNIATTTGTILLIVDQPFVNHNGGSLKFGIDGFLYIGMGDGGSGGDPNNYAQNTTIDIANPSRIFLGKMLRIDVNTTTGSLPYGIPPTNPYATQVGKQEIWAIGLRNPWGFSFDKKKGDLWIADVGQDAVEEVNKVSSTQAGLNFGWRCYEGNAVFNITGCGVQSALTAPLIITNHSDDFCSVTGGYVYNGTVYQNLQGKYLFTDYCNSKIGIATSTGGVTYTQNFAGNNFSCFGEDINGELYVVALNTGTIYKITDATLGITNFVQKEYKIYPNPAKNQISIESSSTTYPVEVTIFDLNGKQLLFQKTQNTDKNTINTSVLAKGLYLMNIKNNLNATSTQKVVIE